MNKELEEAIKYLKIIKDTDLLKAGYVYGTEAIETVLNYIENSIPKKVIEEKIEELYEEFNKLDKEIDEYLNDGNKNLAKCYENRERVAIMQTIGHIAGKFEELLEVE